MKGLYVEALKSMEATLRIFESRVPKPQTVSVATRPQWRYVERTIHQALVQKLARVVTCLHSAAILNWYGFYQDQGALQRMLDEFGDDVLFLALGDQQGLTDDHNNYLRWFWEEEFDKESSMESTQKRGMVPREKIRKYVIGSGGQGPREKEAFRTIHKGYSGFVHGASPHIMDMYGGDPPSFHTRGMRGTPRERDSNNDLWNFFFRAILSLEVVAKLFGDAGLFDRIHEFRIAFEKDNPNKSNEEGPGVGEPSRR